jgi:predicted nucleic acid-binding Zn ribbon protein
VINARSLIVSKAETLKYGNAEKEGQLSVFSCRKRSLFRKAVRPGPFGVDCGVPTYIYETTDQTKPIRNFEVKQSVHDEPLRSDPKTGEAVRRIISAGYSILIPGKSAGPSVGSVGSH